MHELVEELQQAAEQPGRQVEDRASAIRITALRTITVRGNLFVKIETNRGITVWGARWDMEVISQ